MRILLIDSNPENRKSLEGLLRYRTQHDCVVVENHTDGARQAVAVAPDLIMMNVLLFMGNNYAFPRVLQQHEKTKHISFLVQTNGRLDEVTEKQIQASGMAQVVYLPLSADELELAIEEAVHHAPRATKDNHVSNVVWPQASETNRVAKTRKQPQSVNQSPKVQTVQWPTVSKNSEDFTRQESNLKKHRPSPKSQSKPRVVTPKAVQKNEFKAANFAPLAEDVQGTPKFKTQRWQTVDPKDLKKRK